MGERANMGVMKLSRNCVSRPHLTVEETEAQELAQRRTWLSWGSNPVMLHHRRKSRGCLVRRETCNRLLTWRVLEIVFTVRDLPRFVITWGREPLGPFCCVRAACGKAGARGKEGQWV